MEEFEATLKEIVNAKRVSARKMNNLTEIAMKSLKDDTKLVSILYRTHKTLPPVAKISSLYVFDALSRAARSHANKHPQANDPRSAEGNSATFLLKVEGILEGLFSDMVALEQPEAKEKTQKILDIWIKGNTFPSTILSRLKEITEQGKGKKEPEVNNANVPVPRPEPPTTNSPTNAVPDPQATLLALLAQAANASTSTNGGQIHPNTGSAQPPAQLALIQQLAKAAKAADGPPGQSQRPSQAGPFNGGAAPFGGSSSRSPPSQSRDYSRSNYAGPSRGARGFRGRRGDTRGRWDDRDRGSYRERSPPRRRQSRSRSPPSRYGGGGRRDVRLYSPPRKPSAASTVDDQTSMSIRKSGELEKDEFGRDIRPPSPSPGPSEPILMPAAKPDQPPPVPETLSSEPSVEPTPPLNPSNQSSSASVSVATVPTSETVAKSESAIQPQMTTGQFDYTNPASWEALGNQWQMAYGYTPSTEEIMQYVMAGGMVPNQMVAGGPTQGWPIDSWEEPVSSFDTNGWQSGRGRGRGGFNRGRGGHGHGNPRDTQGPIMQDGMETDAIVLGGGESISLSSEVKSPIEEAHQHIQANANTGGTGGKMERVGDKWVFVRGTGVGS
ncbi:CID domain-containing protein [Pleurotus pulmonarius]